MITVGIEVDDFALLTPSVCLFPRRAKLTGLCVSDASLLVLRVSFDFESAPCYNVVNQGPSRLSGHPIAVMASAKSKPYYSSQRLVLTSKQKQRLGDLCDYSTFIDKVRSEAGHEVCMFVELATVHGGTEERPELTVSIRADQLHDWLPL